MKTHEPELNCDPRISLLDETGLSLGLISQSEATHLLRHDCAKLLPDNTPTVQLVTSVAEYLEKKKKLSTPNFQHLFSRKTVLYGNYCVQHPDGSDMFRTSPHRVLWYLNRGLVEFVSADPPTVRFKNVPNGCGHAGDNYYLDRKSVV